MRLVNMNHSKIAIFSLLLLLMSSCRDGKSEADEVMTFKRVKMEKTIPLNNEKDSPKCTVFLDMYYASDEDGEPGRRLNSTIISDLFN